MELINTGPGWMECTHACALESMHALTGVAVRPPPPLSPLSTLVFATNCLLSDRGKVGRRLAHSESGDWNDLA
ncbi:hypothetical protein PoB_005701800 [Plakobranchus ocellatus]|uniref:Uncharacterized protein n=1 Tax=Plakobranchus ocellatus TaxID=259542 RepID=A0AAV4CG86_9GAST|nr:hypothetical protein PoB_005701800 [Plakobranchus ocellatus]